MKRHNQADGSVSIDKAAPGKFTLSSSFGQAKTAPTTAKKIDFTPVNPTPEAQNNKTEEPTKDEKKEEPAKEAPKSLFGSAATPDTKLFAKPAAGSLFGNNSASATPATGLFGGKPSTGSLFGNNTSPAPLFGGTKTESKPLFGNATADKPFGSSEKPALFGGAPKAASSLFGGAATE